MTVHINGFKTSYNTKIHETRANDDEGVGTLREKDGRLYMWALLSIGADTPAKGDALGYVSTSFTGYTVSTDVSACITDVLAGAIQNETDTDVPADGEYFWMQIKGRITLSTTVEDSAAAGNALGLGAGDGACGKATTLKPHSGILINATTLDAILDCAMYVKDESIV